MRDWIITLCANHPGNSSVLTIVDGFCGGGFYLDPESDQFWEGSPIRILRVVESAMREVREKRGKPRFILNIKVFFIDNEDQHTECLKDYLKSLEDNHKSVKFHYQIITKEFSDVLDYCLDDIKKEGQFFLLC
ncbi:hypothetical protein LEP1GSC133_3303 [Leptospira borgpetersenii serovar Pomona str. 200901868]|uniref:Uncharacterized protein n=1 Tax=Leptospira borgpetersenii serovar Pomona str. 200901868 TaxID=1192866 RepID=M6VX07_LEPBO|nr:hypothetical protein LEP1GSC133_3303 [Leptospira borgpetersenii serovar Pomona str. 200901868]